MNSGNFLAIRLWVLAPIHGALAAFVLSGAALSSACETFHYCEPAPSSRIDRAPDWLSKTGLFVDVAKRTLASDVHPYRPEFELWSDGASKRRWVYLPPGETIDTHAMDDWRFPVGAKLWKEFSYRGAPVETRLLQKLGPGERDWLTISYLWNDDHSDAHAVPQGVVDARGTPLDVPAAGECAACHGGRRSFVLGFSALQLSRAAPDAECVDLTELEAEGRLSDPPGQTFALGGTLTERSALGYLHANCGHCHNQNRPPTEGSRCFDPKSDLDFWLRVEQLDGPERTPTYLSAIGSVIEPGQPGKSRMIDLVSSRGMFRQMPPLASEQVDDQGVRLLSAWIRELGSQ